MAGDTSAQGHNGQLGTGPAADSGDPTLISDGRFGSALAVDGDDDVVRVADSASLEPATAITVEAWVRSLISPGQYRYVLSKGAEVDTGAS